ncbi:MAG: hypothetical protein CVV47_14710 [Spirochaetae bacterium HGW-Spirochaetae-3]|jgi:hypothetical protein|nr:MAG: hypothetical protein CVV47_14710 [Spirochaetae bacterium HGW-Spirochaetae-3]
MSVFFFTADRGSALPGGIKPSADFEIAGIELLRSHTPEPGDMCYVDLSGLDEAARKKALATVKRRCGAEAWGVVDPKGAVEDPASVFFAGASDYVGPAAYRAGLGKARVKAALAFACSRRDAAPTTAERSSTSLIGSSPASAPRGEFEGWKSVRAGSVYPFCFLYVAASAHMNLKTRLGEAGYIAFRDRLRHQVQQGLAEADSLLWMETETSALYLVPPYAKNAEVATEACLRMLLGTPLLGYERLCLPFPISLTFALHYGSAEFEPPGKTGTIVSDAVNFSYHLGVKRAEPGRLTISGEAAGLAVPRALTDLFVPAGTFEGRSILHSRRFGV